MRYTKKEIALKIYNSILNKKNLNAIIKMVHVITDIISESGKAFESISTNPSRKTSNQIDYMSSFWGSGRPAKRSKKTSNSMPFYGKKKMDFW